MTSERQNIMNTEIWQGIGYIADSEPLMRRLARYVKKLVKEKDPTLMTKDDFFARVDAAKNGPTFELAEDETIEDLIKRVD